MEDQKDGKTAQSPSAPTTPDIKTSEPETEAMPQIPSDVTKRHVPPANAAGQLPPKKAKLDPTVAAQVEELKQQPEFVSMLQALLKPKVHGAPDATTKDDTDALPNAVDQKVQLQYPQASEEKLQQQKQMLRMMLFASSLLMVYAIKQVALNVWCTETTHPDSELVQRIRQEAKEFGMELEALTSTNSPGVIYWLANTMHLWTIQLGCWLALASLTITGGLVIARFFIGNDETAYLHLSLVLLCVAVLTMTPLVFWQMDCLMIKFLRVISALQPYPLAHENFPFQLLVCGPLWVLLCGWLVR